jgi:hypothetical protein
LAAAQAVGKTGDRGSVIGDPAEDRQALKEAVIKGDRFSAPLSDFVHKATGEGGATRAA